MMTVLTKLGPDGFGGIGLFADRFIPKGTIVWSFHPDIDRRFTLEEFAALEETPAVWDFYFKYSYPIFNAGGEKVGWEFNTDHAKFTNHNDDPNTRNLDLENVVAVRDIELGEEITCDYREYYRAEDAELMYEQCPYIRPQLSAAAE